MKITQHSRLVHILSIVACEQYCVPYG